MSAAYHNAKAACHEWLVRFVKAEIIVARCVYTKAAQFGTCRWSIGMCCKSIAKSFIPM